MVNPVFGAPVVQVPRPEMIALSLIRCSGVLRVVGMELHLRRRGNWITAVVLQHSRLLPTEIRLAPGRTMGAPQ